MAIPGSQTMTEFCEQVNPRVLLEMRRQRPSPDMLRVQESWVAATEKRALLWLAARTPERIGPDHLTILGLAAQIGAGVFYALAFWNRLALLGVIACLTLNWLGDSLDGTLARVRQRLRPRYGELIASLGPVRVGLHVCGGNPRRKRVYFTRYTDLAPAFRKARIDEVVLEHCTLGYNLMDLWKLWDFRGDLAVGVIDQRRDEIETPDVIRERVKPALEYFSPERLLLTSECGFGHVPLEITRAKLAVLTSTAKEMACSIPDDMR